jgi:hypothetical protein
MVYILLETKTIDDLVNKVNGMM